ncbi:uncharacterized protein LOC141604616 [Silene latifolia]|uniref:uncharacterized protein LOC141604616 n=1 Tax=Silene latifolia TaxID=37657 RepID=UPI003D78534F
MKTDRKPPLARSPMRPRSRRALKPSNTNTPLRTPTARMTKPQMKSTDIMAEHQAISVELSALSKMVQDELAAMNAKNNYSTGTTKLGSGFEKGQFYDEYIAMRNERLRKKKAGNEVDEPKAAYSLRVKVDASNKKVFKKKAESIRKSVAASPAIYTVDRSQHPRYSLRSTAKKPPLPVPMNVEEQTPARKTAAVSRSRRK